MCCSRACRVWVSMWGYKVFRISEGWVAGDWDWWVQPVIRRFELATGGLPNEVSSMILLRAEGDAVSGCME